MVTEKIGPLEIAESGKPFKQIADLFVASQFAVVGCLRHFLLNRLCYGKRFNVYPVRPSCVQKRKTVCFVDQEQASIP